MAKVDTDDLDFACDGSPPKKANAQQVAMQKEAAGQQQAKVQLTGHITASCLIEALSADPVNPALKHTFKNKTAILRTYLARQDRVASNRRCCATSIHRDAGT